MHLFGYKYLEKLDQVNEEFILKEAIFFNAKLVT